MSVEAPFNSLLASWHMTENGWTTRARGGIQVPEDTPWDDVAGSLATLFIERLAASKEAERLGDFKEARELRGVAVRAYKDLGAHVGLLLDRIRLRG